MSKEYSFWTDQSKKDRYSIGDHSPHQAEIIEFLRNNLREPQSGDPVIADFGTFTGRNIPALQDIARKATVIGTDIGAAENELKIARQKNPQAEFLQMDLEHIAFQDQSIDGALCWRVLHNLSSLEKIEAALAEIHRTLKENAPCIISVRSTTNIGRDLTSGNPVCVNTPLPHGGERAEQLNSNHNESNYYWSRTRTAFRTSHRKRAKMFYTNLRQEHFRLDSQCLL